tara:strand:- start:1620 stop:2978 length:1359 start_codon:yes stop_codon:yes gene_type:complete
LKGIPGIGSASGLPPDIVDQLMQAERIPVQNLENKKAKSQARLDLVNYLGDSINKIKENIGELANSRGFRDMKLISGDENILQGTVDPLTAQKGSWNIEVVQMAEKAAAVSNGFPDKDTTEIGVGYISFDTSEGEKEVYIDAANSTLDGVAQAINRADVGIQASVIQDKADKDYPWKIILSGKGVGEDNVIEYPTVYMLDGDMDFFFEQKREAKNGIIKLDGLEIEVSENQLNNIIPGVVVDIKQSAPGRVVNVSVKEDLEVVSGKVKSFVDSINEVLQFIQQQNQLTEASDTSKTLGGDQVLRSIEYKFRTLLQGSMIGTGSSIQRLSQLGIEFNRNGTLDFKQETFDAVLSRNPDEVQKFLAGDGFATGFIPRLRRTVNIVMDNSFGPVSNKRRSLQNEIDRADQRIESIERRLVNKERMLKRKFANLEQNMSRIKGQGALLEARLGGGQ